MRGDWKAGKAWLSGNAGGLVADGNSRIQRRKASIRRMSLRINSASIFRQ